MGNRGFCGGGGEGLEGANREKKSAEKSGKNWKKNLTEDCLESIGPLGT